MFLCSISLSESERWTKKIARTRAEDKSGKENFTLHMEQTQYTYTWHKTQHPELHQDEAERMYF